jgi:hypothetical protein
LQWETFDCEASGSRYQNEGNGVCKGIGLAPDLKLLQFIFETPIKISATESARLHGKAAGSFGQKFIERANQEMRCCKKKKKKKKEEATNFCL